MFRPLVKICFSCRNQVIIPFSTAMLDGSVICCFSLSDNNALLAQLINNARNNGGYTTIPTSNNQTLLIGPLLSNAQAGNYNQQGQQGKPNDMAKVGQNYLNQSDSV